MFVPAAAVWRTAGGGPACPGAPPGRFGVLRDEGICGRRIEPGANSSQMSVSLASVEDLRRLLTSRRTAWVAVALVCVAAGAVGSLLGARAVARKDGERARETFQRSAGGVASTLQLTLQRDGGVAVGASTFFAANPQATRAEFQRWAAWAAAGRHSPELDRLALVGLTPARQTAAQLAAAHGGLGSAAARPPAGVGRDARLVSVGARAGGSYYCYTVGEIGPGRSSGQNRDCLLTPTLLLTRDSGRTRYRSTSIDGAPALVFDTPVYRGNATPSTVAGRRAAFVGWLREVLLPQPMLQQALYGYPGEALRVRYRTASTSLLFTSGAPQAGGQSATANLHGGWTARILGAPAQAGVLANGNSLALLILGCLASVLAVALVYVLGARRAWRSPATSRASDGGGGGERLYDALTGLPNRALTLDRAECMLARVGRQSGMLTGALLVDLDWFEDINEKLGREAGDQLLRVAAERLQSVVRADDTVGRLGEDKFVALVESQARGVKLESLAARMIEALREPVELEGFGPSFHMTASIGVAFGRYARTEELLADTQIALDAAKAAGKDRFTLFNANLRSVIEDRGVLDSELNAALQDKQFMLLYQPIYDLGSRRVVGVEALIRWEHPERGVVPPADFISAAEETALIVPIGRWALEEACTRAAAWNAAGHRVGVAVKVSPGQLNRDGFASDVLRALQQSGIEPSALTLEIPEAAVIGDVDAAAVRLGEIAQLGVRVAIEDFGNGYAHRSDLQRLPVSFLKVDRGAVAESDDEDYRSWLLEAIVLFARDLSLGVIATGVRSAEQLANLQRIGCTLIQGSLVGEPAPADAVEPVLGAELPGLEAPAMAAAPEPVVEQPAAPVGEGPSTGVGEPAAAPVGEVTPTRVGEQSATGVSDAPATPIGEGSATPVGSAAAPEPGAAVGSEPGAVEPEPGAVEPAPGQLST
jgi:diguanylate cyclase (GGDEF)-like protein